jgi:adenylate cyclase
VSENIVNAVPGVVYRELDRVRVKGKLEPISIYEPVGKKGDIGSQMLDEIDRFHRALDKFREQRWDDAEQALVKLAHADPHRKVYQVYIDRISKLRLKPPGANWDGVFTFTTKYSFPWRPQAADAARLNQMIEYPRRTARCCEVTPPTAFSGCMPPLR